MGTARVTQEYLQFVLKFEGYSKRLENLLLSLLKECQDRWDPKHCICLLIHDCLCEYFFETHQFSETIEHSRDLLKNTSTTEGKCDAYFFLIRALWANRNFK